MLYVVVHVYYNKNVHVHVNTLIMFNKNWKFEISGIPDNWVISGQMVYFRNLLYLLLYNGLH